MLFSWMSKLKSKLKFGYFCINLEVKAGLSRPHGPDLHYLIEAAEEERLLCEVEGGAVQVHCCFPMFLRLKFLRVFHGDNLNWR